MATEDFPGKTTPGSSKGDGIGRPVNYSRNANKHSPRPILGETAVWGKYFSPLQIYALEIV